MLREIAKDILQSDSPRVHLGKQFARKQLRLRCRAGLNEVLHAVGKGLQAVDERLHLLGRGLTQGRRGQRTSPDGELARDSCQVAEMQHAPETLPPRRRVSAVPLQRRGKICASAKEAAEQAEEHVLGAE